jgi:hypothetical protein
VSSGMIAQKNGPPCWFIPRTFGPLIPILDKFWTNAFFPVSVFGLKFLYFQGFLPVFARL